MPRGLSSLVSALCILHVGCDAPETLVEVLEPNTAYALEVTDTTWCGALVERTGTVWTVLPSNIDDTASLRCALQEAAMFGPETVVRLLTGDYRTHVVEVVDFEGTLLGAGKDRTRLHAIEPGLCVHEGSTGYPGLLYFRGGSPRISSLAIENPERDEEGQLLLCGGTFGTGQVVHAPAVVFTQSSPTAVDSPVHSEVVDVEVRGAVVLVRPAQQQNYAGDHIVADRILGDHLVSRTRFLREISLVTDPDDPYSFAAFAVLGASSGSVTFGASCSDGNVVEGAAVVIQATVDSHVEVSYNDIQFPFGANGISVRLLAPSETLAPAGRHRVTRNHLRSGVELGRAIFVIGESSVVTDVHIERNLIEGEARFGSGIVVGDVRDPLSLPLEGGEIVGNRFEGFFGVGVALVQGSHWQIARNDFVDFDVVSGFNVILLEDTRAMRVVSAGRVADEGVANRVRFEPGTLRTNTGPQCADVEFIGQRGNPWWVEIDLDADFPIAAVEARIDRKAWFPLQRTPWGSWASGVLVPVGSRVQFRTYDLEERMRSTPFFLWPVAEVASLEGAQHVLIKNPRGNEWWVETDIEPSQPVVRVELDYDASDLPLILLPTLWGSYAANEYVEPGSIVRFRTLGLAGDRFVSAAYSWPDAQLVRPASPFSATFFDARGNEDWIEVQVDTLQHVAAVDYSVERGPWRPLSLTSWGSWATASTVGLASVEFRARSEGGVELRSGAYSWPPR